jgi:hypothetical protein
MDGMTTALMRQKKLDDLGKKKKEEAIKIWKAANHIQATS